MADETKVVVFEIDRLLEFVDDLRASGYQIDPRQIAVLNHLLLTLIARGEALEQLPLKLMIAPLVCSTPLEQEDFYQRFERWQVTLLPIKKIDSEGEVPFAPPLEEVDIPPAIETDIPQETPYITRGETKQETSYTKVLVKGYVRDILPVSQIKPIVSGLRKRTQVPSTEVDVERTIEYAISHNNWMKVNYRQRQVLPEYVVLIDRKNRLDLQARFVQEVLAKLAADGVWLHQYEFKGDPRICFPLDKKNTSLRLRDLQARHPDARLLLFSGANELTNPLTGNLQEWVENLDHWKERAVLTSDTLAKSLREELEAQDFAVLPMTFEGLASIVRVFESENILLPFGDSNLPAPLTERPTRWTGRSVPPETEVRSLIHELKNKYFDKNESGFYWLCSTAVYPELRWELTLHLGSVLRNNAGEPLLDVKTLILLSRLPWFRIGFMPDWIRLPLIESFLPEQELQVREVLSNLLSAAQDGLAFELAIAREMNAVLPKQILQDHVMIKFLASSEKKKIDLTVPASLQNIFDQDQTKTDQLDDPKSLLDSSPASSIIDEKHITLKEETRNNLIDSTPNQIGYKRSSNLKPRVLIVENDPNARVSYQTLLMQWGYDTVLAMGSGNDLIDNAKRLAKEKRCALALIDTKLVDDYDVQDVSGLRLAEEFSNQLTPIVMSGYENFNALRNLLQKPEKIPLFNKADHREAIKEILDTEAAKVTAAKSDLVFENVELVEEITSAFEQFTGGYTDQVADLFVRLFPRARKIRLEKLESSTISTAPRSRSVVVKVYEDDLEPCMVKISLANRIQREVDNYHKFIARKLTGQFSSRIERSPIFWDIGAISYSYIGDIGTRTFSRFYEEESIPDIEDCLSHFFRKVWGRHYDQAHVVHDVSLFKLYSLIWGNWYERIKDASDPDSSYLEGLYEQMNLPRPIEWIKNNIAEASDDVSFLSETRVAITHGDLQGDNLLVGRKNTPWLISFERSGEGHILQDFIALESDIINRLDTGDENLSNYIRLLTAILEQKTIQELDSSKLAATNERYEKAFQTISILRSLAFTSTGVTNAREYYLGLLFNMVYRASTLGINSPASQRALLCASLICHRLDHWDQTWSLSDAKKDSVDKKLKKTEIKKNTPAKALGSFETQSTPFQYREEFLMPFFEYIKSGESFYIISMPKVGVNRLIDFVMGTRNETDKSEIQRYYLGEAEASITWLVLVDMNRMSRIPNGNWGFSFYELLLNSILLACGKLETTDKKQEILEKLASLDAEVIKGKDSLMAHRLFEMAINMLCQSYDLRLCFLFVEFDNTYADLSSEIFAQLRAIRDANKHRISYALFLRTSPEKLRFPTAADEGFYELFSHNGLGLGPYSERDTLLVIRQLEERKNHALRESQIKWLVTYSGGHPGLIQVLFNIVIDQTFEANQINDLKWCSRHEKVNEEFYKIWTGLAEEEKTGLQEIVRGRQTSIKPSTFKFLLSLGLIKPMKNNIEFFTPLFSYWLLDR